MNAVCVFCGANVGYAAAYREAAVRLATELARRGLGLVYGGGRVGLMGVLADAAVTEGATVVGIIPEVLAEREIAHGGLSELILTTSMHERKSIMAERADGFIALPGGFGTLEEFCEILTWGQLGIHRKPIGLLNVDGFYDPLIAYFDHAVTQGFIRPVHRSLILQAADAAALLDAFASYAPPDLPLWATPAAS